MNAQPPRAFAWPVQGDSDDEVRVTPGTLAAVRARVVETLAQNDALQLAFSAARPFLLVTPLGMPARARLHGALAASAIDVRYRTLLPGWPAAATRLYARSPGDEDVCRGAAYEQAWRSRFEPQAEVWALDGPVGYMRLLVAKYDLRERFRAMRLDVDSGAGRLRIKLHSFHVPDPLRLPIEDWWVRRLSSV